MGEMTHPPLTWIGLKETVRTKNMQLNSRTLSCIVEEEDEDNTIGVAATVSTESDVIEMVRRILPSMPLNPSGKAAIKAVYDKWGEHFKVAGFVATSGDGRVSSDDIRFWAFLVSDLGAAC